MKILVVEDDTATAKTVKDSLTAHSHVVEVATDGADGSFMGRSYDYDAIILDYSMPKKDGLSVCKEIRASGKTTPIIFLSMNSETDLKINALESGADDYMIKPFSMEELHSRLRAIVRRPTNQKINILRVDDLSMDVDRNIVMRGKSKIDLTNKEFCLLEYLMRNAGIVLSRGMILEHVWTADMDPFSNTVETHMRYVKKKICPGNKPNLIENIQSRGYVIDIPANLSKLSRVRGKSRSRR